MRECRKYKLGSLGGSERLDMYRVLQLSTEGHIAPRDMCKCPDIFLAITMTTVKWGRGCYWYLVSKG